ncbi:MAG: hypothetical protein Q8Q54_05915 [Methylococcales bacterium]|nr:hypothetical protein [Methylococcales bacterium]
MSNIARHRIYWLKAVLSKPKVTRRISSMHNIKKSGTLTDLIGNGVAWENELDMQRLYETIPTKKISFAH